MAKRRTRERHPADGVALAITLLTAGGLCVFAPRYFDADGWQETAWHIAGLLVAVVGSFGLIAEITKTNRRKQIGDVGVGAACLLIALGCALAVRAWDPPRLINGSMRAIVAFFTFFGIYGVVGGVAKAVHERRQSDRATTQAETVVAILVGLIGLATAGVNLLAAFQTLPSSP